MLDRIRRVEDETAAPDEAALDDVLFIGASAPGLDRVDAHGAHATERRHVVWRARRHRGHQTRAGERQVEDFGYAHGASLGLVFAQSMSDMLSLQRRFRPKPASKSAPPSQSGFPRPARLSPRYAPG